MQNLNLKKFFLHLLIASVAFSALLGIGVILFGDFGEFETKILLTALTVTVTSILGLACGAYLETKRELMLPVGGIGFSVLSAILWVILIWSRAMHNEYFVRTLLSVTVLAASCSHLSLISLAQLDKKFLWSRLAVQIAVWILTAYLLWLIWFEKDFASDLIPRLIGVLTIVIAALTIVTPIFHRLSQQKPETEEIDAEIARLRARIEELEEQRGEISLNEN